MVYAPNRVPDRIVFFERANSVRFDIAKPRVASVSSAPRTICARPKARAFIPFLASSARVFPKCRPRARIPLFAPAARASYALPRHGRKDDTAGFVPATPAHVPGKCAGQWADDSKKEAEVALICYFTPEQLCIYLFIFCPQNIYCEGRPGTEF